MTLSDSQHFYTSHSPFTDPGLYAPLYVDLPSGLDELCAVVNGLIVHNIWVGMGQMQISEERKKEANIRSMQAKLRRILEMDERPLTEARPFQDRLFGNCRDEALCLCSFLRHFGIPARVRKGFMANMGPKNFDHAVCQVWSASHHRWLTVDVQMDNMARESQRLPPEARQFLASITPRDTPPHNFLTGGQAWLKCRSGEDDPLSYGIEGDLWGLWMVRHNLLRDLLALVKLELLPWDMLPGSLISHDRADPSPEQLAFLDCVAETIQGNEINLTEVQRLVAAEPSLHVPEEWYLT